MIDLEKHKANFRIVHRYDSNSLKWFYYCECKEGIFFKTWNWHWKSETIQGAEEYSKK